MASRSVNHIILVGNLTRNPEMKTTTSGKSVCVFGLATNRDIPSSSDEEREETQFHRLVAWEKLGELAGKLLRKGRKIYVEGRLNYRTYTDSDGQMQGVCEIVVDDFILLDPKPMDRDEEASDESLRATKKSAA